MVVLRGLALLGAALLLLGTGACADSEHCEAAFAGMERMRADAARQEAQMTWLRVQLATFAADLQARNAADREALLHRLASLEATNAALVQRLEQGQGRIASPVVEPSPPARPAAAPLP